MLALVFEALNDSGLKYLKDHLLPTEGLLVVPLPSEAGGWGRFQDRAFSVLAPKLSTEGHLAQFGERSIHLSLTLVYF